jgi:hypothetical protein
MNKIFAHTKQKIFLKKFLQKYFFKTYPHKFLFFSCNKNLNADNVCKQKFSQHNALWKENNAVELITKFSIST